MSTFDPFNLGIVLFYYLQSTPFGFVDYLKQKAYTDLATLCFPDNKTINKN